MNRKQTHFLVAPPTFGGAPLFIAYNRDVVPTEREAVELSRKEAVEKETSENWFRSALSRAEEAVRVAWWNPRSKRRLNQSQRIGI